MTQFRNLPVILKLFKPEDIQESNELPARAGFVARRSESQVHGLDEPAEEVRI